MIENLKKKGTIKGGNSVAAYLCMESADVTIL